MTETYRALLRAQGTRERKHESGHSYSLEEFGLEADEIHTKLADLFERFEWAEQTGGA